MASPLVAVVAPAEGAAARRLIRGVEFSLAQPIEAWSSAKMIYMKSTSRNDSSCDLTAGFKLGSDPISTP
jgi:multidrug efflux pump subunit AcrB